MWSRASHTIRRIKQTWSELDHAQRRLFEVRTGIPVTPEGERAQARAESRELELLFAREQREARERSVAREHPEERGAPAPAPVAHAQGVA
jgi:hypothetical protein